MKTIVKKGKIVLIISMNLCCLVFLLFLFYSKDIMVEYWWLWKLETGTHEEKRIAVENLGNMRSKRAVQKIILYVANELSELENIEKYNDIIDGRWVYVRNINSIEPACLAIKKAGPDSIHYLLSGLKSGDRYLSGASARLICESKMSSKNVIDPIIKLLKHDNKNVRCSSAYVLEIYGKDAGNALQDLIMTINDKEPDVRRNVAYALGSISVENEESSFKITKALLVLLKDVDQSVRWAAAVAIDEQGQKYKTQADFILSELFIDDKIKINSNELARISSVIIPILVECLESDNAEKRYSAIKIIEKMSINAKKLIPNLEKAKEDSDKRVRETAKNAIKIINADE